jgi:hypothetical protein
LALDRGAMSMANEYALALVSGFLSGPFDLIGASFGAILASHVSCASKAAGGRPRRLVLIDPPPATSKALPVPKMATSLRTAAMGVLLIHLHIEMGASVWEQFPQLQTLPDGALACFVASQCLPEGSSAAALRVLAERFERLLLVYRQCRHAFHVFSANLDCVAHANDGGTPAILMALSSDRWLTFREMFPGVKEDAIDRYGPAATVQRPGKHIAMINRCLSNRDPTFTGALERFLGDAFVNAWWLVESLSTVRKQLEPAQEAATSGLRADDLIDLLSSLSSSPSAPQECEASEGRAVNVAAAVQQVRHLTSERATRCAFELPGSPVLPPLPRITGGAGAARLTHIVRRTADGSRSRLTGRCRVPQSAVERVGRRKVARDSHL